MIIKISFYYFYCCSDFLSEPMMNIPLCRYLSYPVGDALFLILIILRSPLAHQIISLGKDLQEDLESCQSNVFPAVKTQPPLWFSFLFCPGSSCSERSVTAIRMRRCVVSCFIFDPIWMCQSMAPNQRKWEGAFNSCDWKLQTYLFFSYFYRH